MKVVIIGGGAAGASCATRLRRLDENIEILILEKTGEVSIANCGLPYYCSGVIKEREKILVSTPLRFKAMFNIDVRLNTEVTQINRSEKFVLTKDGEKIYYDKLVLSQGANPIKPPINGINNKNVFTVRNLDDIDKIKDYIKNNNAQKAVVIGGGFIGVEMAENLNLMGLKTSLVEMQSQILAPVDFEVAAFAQNEMRQNGVELILSDGVKAFFENEIELNSGKKIPYDLIILAIGVKPEIELAKNAGLNVNRGIITNDFMQTNDPDIFAGGDNVEVKSFINNENVLIPLAGPANRQGRIIADNILGKNSKYKKSQGTSVIKVFDYTIAATGLNEKQLKGNNIPYWKIFTFGNSHASYYPNATQTLYKLLFNNEGEILGAQAVGQEGVEKRVDVIASVMRNGGKIQELLDSELCYAPPYSSAKDPVNILGMAAENLLSGLFKPAYYEDIEGSFVIDVRTPDVFKINGIKGAINIPLAELRKRYNEIPKDKKVILICNTGYTSYLASRILIQKGFNNVYSFMGGTKLYSEIEKNKQNKTVQKTLVAANAKTSESALKIDACGLSCPGPVMKLAESLEKIKEGETIEITSNDKGFYSDVQAWCVSTNNTLINLTDKDKKNKNVPALKELIQQAQRQGVKFIACNMTMDIMGIKEEELIDNIKIAGVAKYILESGNSNANLFI